MREILHLPKVNADGEVIAGSTVRADIHVNTNGSSITIDGFKATLMQLRLLSMRRNLKPEKIYRGLGIVKGTYEHTLRRLVDVNANDFSDRRPTLDELTEIADKHELLYPISIRGMEALTEEMRSNK
jgi:hypothetical protein